MIAIQSGYFCPQLGLDASAALFSCVIQLIHPAGNWRIIDHLFLSFPFLFLLFFLMQIPLHLSLSPLDLLFSFNISVSCGARPLVSISIPSFPQAPGRWSPPLAIALSALSRLSLATMISTLWLSATSLQAMIGPLLYPSLHPLNRGRQWSDTYGN